MNCMHPECQKPFTHGQTVFVSTYDGGANATYCSEKCRKSNDKDMFPIHSQGTYVVSELPIPAAHLRSVTKKTGPKGDQTVTVQLEIPCNTSLDAINKYEGACTLKLSHEEIVNEAGEVMY